MAAASDLRRGFEFGPFTIIPERGIVRKDGEDVRLEPKQMDALVALARHYPAVVSKEMLVEEVWGGRPISDESIVQCIKGIRQALDNDDPRNPNYVETITKSGYRLMMPIKVPEAEAPEVAGMQIPRTWWIAGAAALVVLAIIVINGLGEPDGEPQPIDSVVVTRFENLSGEQIPPITYGFTEQVITTLNQIPKLAVKKGRLPGQDELDEDIADFYDVLSVVRGSVQEYRGQLRVTAQIVNSDGVNLWAGTFDGPVDELFSLHEQVAIKVRDAIVGHDEGAFAASNRPTNSAAERPHQLGLGQLARRDLDSLRRAADLFEESIELDPGYGRAYLALANTYVLLADYGSQDAMFDRAITTVENGIAKDPTIADRAMTYIGYVQTKRGDWAGATNSFEIATASEVQYPPALHYYSRLMAATGRIGDSLAAAQAAWEMNQYEQVLNSRLAIAHLWNNDQEQARTFYVFANAQGEGAPIHLLSYTLFLIRDGDYDNASKWAERGLEKLTNQKPVWVAPVFEAMKQLPDSQEMIAALDEYEAQGQIGATALVTLRALAGEDDRAMEIVWQLIEDPSLFELELIYLDEFSGMRQRDDFPAFLDEIGLTEYWQSEGCRWDKGADAVVCGAAE